MKTVRLSSVVEVVVARSLVCWVWDFVVVGRRAKMGGVLELMPPEGAMDLQWTSSVAVFRAPDDRAEEKLLWCAILFVAVGTSICALVWQKATRKTGVSCTNAQQTAKLEGPMLKGARKSLKVKTPGPLDEAFPRIGAIKRGEMLAMSPIREVAGPFSTRPCAVANYTAPVLVSKQIHASSAGTETRGNLALSSIVPIIDIPPTALKQVDDFEEAISQLCELLERW